MTKNKLIAGTAATAIILLNTLTLHAQDPGLPCDGEDPDASCPLDSWVLILAAAAILFVAFHSFRKKTRAA